MNHIVALSGGKDSTAMALRLMEVEPHDYTYICTPTGNELPPMIEHWILLSRLLGKPILPVTSGKSLAGLIRQQNALPSWRMRWCTRMLKIEPFNRYVSEHQPCVIYVGIRSDEADRAGVDYSKSKFSATQRFPLVEWGWGLPSVLAYLDRREVCIPDRTDCAACFFQTLYEWHQLWFNYPAQYAEAEQWEADTGHTLRSETRDSWPASLDGMRGLFEKGHLPPDRKKMADRKAMCSYCAR